MGLEKTAVFEIEEVKEHQNPYASSLQQINYDVSHDVGEIWFNLSAIVICINEESSKVWESKERRNHGVGASFLLKVFLAYTILLHLSIISSLCLHKKPDDQQNHQNYLTEEAPAHYLGD